MRFFNVKNNHFTHTNAFGCRNLNTSKYCFCQHRKSSSVDCWFQNVRTGIHCIAFRYFVSQCLKAMQWFPLHNAIVDAMNVKDLVRLFSLFSLIACWIDGCISNINKDTIQEWYGIAKECGTTCLAKNWFLAQRHFPLPPIAGTLYLGLLGL